MTMDFVIDVEDSLTEIKSFMTIKGLYYSHY